MKLQSKLFYSTVDARQSYGLLEVMGYACIYVTESGAKMLAKWTIW